MIMSRTIFSRTRKRAREKERQGNMTHSCTKWLVLQCVAVCCSVLQREKERERKKDRATLTEMCHMTHSCTTWLVLQCVAVCCSVFFSLAPSPVRGFFISARTHARREQPSLECAHTATHCNTLQHTATHCNTLQHTATHGATLTGMCNMTHSWVSRVAHFTKKKFVTGHYDKSKGTKKAPTPFICTFQQKEVRDWSLWQV